MLACVLDSSALVKAYVAERGTRWVQQLLPAADYLGIAAITRVEVMSAITRREHRRTLTPVEAARARADFWRDLPVFESIPITEAILDQAMNLVEAHGLRGYDAVQLAAALAIDGQRQGTDLDPVVFVSADQDLNAVARAEGLGTEDPNAHP